MHSAVTRRLDDGGSAARDPLTVARARALRMGIDIGGSKIEVVLVEHGRVIALDRLPTGYGARQVLANTAALASTLAANVGLDLADIGAVGVGIPGAIESGTGRVRHAVNLGIDDLALGSELSALLGVPVRIENDVNAAGLGAFHALGLARNASIAYLNLGTGLAAGLVLQGTLWRGSRGTAGEIGHMPVVQDGPLCACGQRGCLELYTSGSGLARMWPAAPGQALAELHKAVAAGDRAAIDVHRTWIEGIASAVRALVLTLDVDSVIIGGGLSTHHPSLLDEVRGVLTEWSARSSFLKMLDLPSRVVLPPTGLPVAALGAALLGEPR
ncbi:ROK family protein [Microbacterium sp. Leaf151]|uniref:ROK family protein n=1 Tax=Microbacterium sp. Leaf151 TaxID=1736276 RepID=UPI001F1B06DD|nr:ROK family protein [Microbacterium sp. Leaf151]